jgi:hypothetical protein
LPYLECGPGVFRFPEILGFHKKEAIMADCEVHKRLRQELDEELKRFDYNTQQAFRLSFNLELEQYSLSTQDVAAILKKTPQQIEEMVSKVRSHPEQKGLLGAIPSRDR